MFYNSLSLKVTIHYCFDSFDFSVIFPMEKLLCFLKREAKSSTSTNAKTMSTPKAPFFICNEILLLNCVPIK